jgi:hypothetical protein
LGGWPARESERALKNRFRRWFQPPLEWAEVNQPPVVVGSENQVTLPLSGADAFYRLFKP